MTLSTIEFTSRRHGRPERSMEGSAVLGTQNNLHETCASELDAAYPSTLQQLHTSLNPQVGIPELPRQHQV
jgi:hypothetical protein